MLNSVIHEELLDRATPRERAKIQAEYNRIFSGQTPDDPAVWGELDRQFRIAIQPIRKQIADRILRHIIFGR